MGQVLGPSRKTDAVGGLTGSRISVPFVQTATATVANSTVEASIIGTGVGTTRIPAGYLAVGSMIVVHLTGSVGTEVVIPTLTIKLYYGATVLSTVTATPAAQLDASTYFEYTGTSVVTAIGASGSLTSGQIMLVNQLTSLGPSAVPAAVTVNTLAAGTIDVKVTWGTAGAASTISGITGYIEVIG